MRHPPYDESSGQTRKSRAMNEFSNQQNTTRSGAQTAAMAIPESVLTASYSRPIRVLFASYSVPDRILISTTLKNPRKNRQIPRCLIF